MLRVSFSEILFLWHADGIHHCRKRAAFLPFRDETRQRGTRAFFRVRVNHHVSGQRPVWRGESPLSVKLCNNCPLRAREPVSRRLCVTWHLCGDRYTVSLIRILAHKISYHALVFPESRHHPSRNALPRLDCGMKPYWVCLSCYTACHDDVMTTRNANYSRS